MIEEESLQFHCEMDSTVVPNGTVRDLNNVNKERAKRRALNDVRMGRRSFVTEAFVSRHHWTPAEYEVIRPYIRTNTHEANTNDSNATQQELFALIDQETRKESTAKTYRSKVNSLLRLFEIENGMFSKIFETHRDDHILKTIRGAYKNASTYLALILWLCDHSTKFERILGPTRIAVYKDAHQHEVQLVTLRTLTERGPGYTDYENIYTTLFEIERNLHKTQYASMPHMIAIMYTIGLYDENDKIHINPRNYFWNVRIVHHDKDLNDKDNLLNVSNGRLVINDYKTADMYRPYDVTLSPAVMHIVRDSLIKFPRHHLLVHDDGQPYSNNRMSEKIKGIMGYSIDTIRKAIESYEVHVRKTSRIHMANVSRHTIATQDMTYVSR